MADINVVALSGTVVEDSVIKHTERSKLLTMRMVVEGDETTSYNGGTFIPKMYVEINRWGNSDYGYKAGTKIKVLGELSIRSVLNEDGTKRHYTSVKADSIREIGKRSDSVAEETPKPRQQAQVQSSISQEPYEDF